MRFNYWSMGIVARWLRKLFGLPPSPYALSSEGWEKFHALEQSKSRFGMWLIDHLDTLQSFVFWIPDSLNSIRARVSNIQYGAHRLPTRNKLGSWHDLASKIPDSLMLSIIQYVEEECFRARLVWDDILPPEAEKFKSQSAFGRLFFPVKVSSEIRRELGLEWMEFQVSATCTTRRARERHGYTKLIEAYKFAKDRYWIDPWDKYADKFAHRLSIEDYKELRIAEDAHEQETIRYCQIIIFHHAHMWT